MATARSNARAKTADPKRVYSFGCLRPDPESSALLRAQAIQANDVQAAMTRNEMEARKRWERVTAKYVPDYRAARDDAERLEGEISEAYEQISTARRQVRKRLRLAQVEARILKLKAERRAAWARMAEAKKPFKAEMAIYWTALADMKREIQGDSTSSRVASEARRTALVTMLASATIPDSWKALARITLRDHETHLTIRRAGWKPEIGDDSRRAAAWLNPIDNDTKELAREAFLQAKAKTAAEGGRMREPRGDTGRVGRMWSSGEPIVAKDGTIRSAELTLLPREGEEDHRKADSRRRAVRRRMVATLRLAGEVVRVRVVCHRLMPPGAKVRRAWFMLRERGKLDLQLVLSHESFGERAPGTRVDAVAVKPGWAATDAAPGATKPVVVATWLGTDGRRGTIEADARTMRSFDFLELLRANQDRYHNEVLALLRRWVEGLDQRRAIAKRLGPMLAHAGSWRSPRHLAAIAYEMRATVPKLEDLWRRWKKNCDDRGADYFATFEQTEAWLKRRRIRDDAVIMAVYLEFWRRKNLHLRRWEQNAKASVLRRRLEGYRIASKALAARYETLLLVEVDLKRAARKTKPDEAVRGPEKVWTKQRRNAAPSELVAALANAFRTTAKKARLRAPSLEAAIEGRAKHAAAE